MVRGSCRHLAICAYISCMEDLKTPEQKKFYENAIRRYRRLNKKGWPLEKVLNEETLKRVIAKNKTEEKE